MKGCSVPLGPPTIFQLATPESPFPPICRGFGSFSIVHMLLYYCLFALVHISSLDGFSMKIFPTCLIFNFGSCHFLFEHAFFMDVSFGRTTSYGPQQVLMALSFIIADNFNF